MSVFQCLASFLDLPSVPSHVEFATVQSLQSDHSITRGSPSIALNRMLTVKIIQESVWVQGQNCISVSSSSSSSLFLSLLPLLPSSSSFFILLFPLPFLSFFFSFICKLSTPGWILLPQPSESWNYGYVLPCQVTSYICTTLQPCMFGQPSLVYFACCMFGQPSLVYVSGSFQ